MTATFARPYVPEWVNELGNITTTGTIEVPLSGGRAHALIDAVDLHRVSDNAWSYDAGYAKAISRTTGRRIYMHRVILGAAPGQQVDHRNRDGLDNRRSNLRFATQVQQNGNNGLSRNNTSGFKGVHAARSGRWVARIGIDHRNVWLGTFDDPADAARAYDAAALDQFGEFACLNFPLEPNPTARRAAL